MNCKFKHRRYLVRCTFNMYQRIEAETKCLPFCREYFWMIFCIKTCVLEIGLLKFVTGVLIHNMAVLVKIIVWRSTGDKSLSKLIVAYPADAYKHHFASVSWKYFSCKSNSYSILVHFCRRKVFATLLVKNGEAHDPISGNISTQIVLMTRKLYGIRRAAQKYQHWKNRFSPSHGIFLVTYDTHNYEIKHYNKDCIHT